MEVVKILEKLADMEFIRLNRIMGKYYSIYCPFHSNGEERKPSFGVLLQEEVRNGRRYPEGWCHCFTCGYVKSLPEMITDILKSRSITQSGLDWLKENIPGFEQDTEFDYLLPGALVTSLTNSYAVDYVRSLTAEPVKYVPEEELQKYRFTVPYMYERKLTDEVIELFDIGYDANWIPPGRKKAVPCITFPVRDATGRTLFLVRRSIQGKFFNIPEYAEKPLYGIDVLPKGCKSVIIVESCINALTLWSWGYKAVALLGTGNAIQMQQLKELGAQEFIICADGDDAGKRATRKLKNQLKSVALVWSVNMPDGKDVNDLTREEFIELYNARE